MARGDTLKCAGDEIARSPLRIGPRFFFHLAHHARHLMADGSSSAWRAPFRLLDRHARDALELLQLPVGSRL